MTPQRETLPTIMGQAEGTVCQVGFGTVDLGV